MRNTLCLLALVLSSIPSAPAVRDLLHPSAPATRRRLADDLTSPSSHPHIEITAATHRHESHHIPLRIPAFGGPWGVEAVANLSTFRSSLLAANARVFHKKEAVLEDKDEKYERFKVRDPLAGRLLPSPAQQRRLPQPLLPPSAWMS
jgi:hypothetical protein